MIDRELCADLRDKLAQAGVGVLVVQKKIKRDQRGEALKWLDRIYQAVLDGLNLLKEEEKEGLWN